MPPSSSYPLFQGSSTDDENVLVLPDERVPLTASPGEADGPLARVSTLALGTTAHDLVLVGNLAYVATGPGMRIIDVSNAAAPVLRDQVDIGSKILGIDVADGYAYLASATKDLKVVDVSNSATPVVVATKTFSGSTWDVAVKDSILYVASFGGEIYVFDVSNPHQPVQRRVVGVPGWVSAGHDPANMTKLRNAVTSGGAKVTDVSIADDYLFAIDCNYGRVYAWDISVPDVPVFHGAHYAKFALRVEADLARGTVYALGALGGSSNIFSLPVSLLDPFVGTSYHTCAVCDALAITAGNFGGLAIAEGVRYVVYIAGNVGSFDVLDVSNPSDMQKVATFPLGKFAIKTGDTLGVKTRGDNIFIAAGALGFQIFSYPGLAD